MVQLRNRKVSVDGEDDAHEQDGQQGGQDHGLGEAAAPPRKARKTNGRKAAKPSKGAKPSGSGRRKSKGKKVAAGDDEDDRPKDQRAELVAAWDDFLSRCSKSRLDGDAMLEYRPAKSRALLIFDATGTEVLPPKTIRLSKDAFDAWRRGLNDADVAAFGELGGRPEHAVIEAMGNSHHCDDHILNHSALWRLWNQYIEHLKTENQPDVEVVEAEWRKLRAIVQLNALEERDRWILPNDETDDPLPDRPWSLFDTMPEDDRITNFKAMFKQQATKELGVKDISETFPGHWVMVDSLGSGGNSDAFLWGQYDSKGRLINRMVAKDTYLVSTQWVSRDEKHRKQDPDTKEWLPREAYMTKRLQGLDSLHHCIVRFLGNRVVASHKMYRIYMELCPFGDLKELIKSHYDISQCVDRDGNRISGYAMQEAKNAYFWLTRRRALPEDVLWSLFESLAAAACIMESGHLPDLPPPKPTSSCPIRERIHGRTTQHSSLGDFGSADETFDGDGRNPNNLFRLGTPGWSAPEQVTQPASYRLDAAANVWAAGNIIAQISTLSDGNYPRPAQLNYQTPQKLPGEDAEEFEDRGGQNYTNLTPEIVGTSYSAELKDLVAECVLEVPEDRIRPADLLKRITQHVGNGSLPMRHRNSEDDVLHYQNDKYKLWAGK